MFILKCGCTNSKLSVLQSSSSIRMCFLASQRSHVPPFCLYSPSSFSLPITIWPIFPGSVQGHLLLESNLWQASLELFFYIITNACYLCFLYLLLSSLCHYLTMLNKIFTDKVKNIDLEVTWTWVQVFMPLTSFLLLRICWFICEVSIY